MASSVNDVSSGRTLASALLAPSPSALATRAVSDPDSGVTGGLRLNAALNENDSGRFSLVSGLTLAGGSVTAAEQELQRLQDIKDSIDNRIAILGNDTYSSAEKDRQRLLLKFDLEDMDKAIGRAGVGGYNLLDATDATGVKLDLNSGEFSNTGTTRDENIAGHDRSFNYSSNEISYQKVDVRAALDELNSLQLLTYPDTEAASSSNGNLYNLSKFQATLDQASNGLTSLRKKLNQAALENVTVSTEPSQGDITSGYEATQMASRLAQQLHNDSFSITAAPVARYFSLFT